MLSVSENRIKKLQQLTKLPNCVRERRLATEVESNQIASNIDAPDGVIPLDREWLSILVGESPILSGRLVCEVIHKTLNTGVHRTTKNISSPGKGTAVLLTSLSEIKNVSKWALETSKTILAKDITSHDIVALAVHLNMNELSNLLHIINKNQWPSYYIETVHSAILVNQMIENPKVLEEADWRSSEILKKFFDEWAYRGIRRRAARIHGASIARRVTKILPVWCNPTQFTFASEGLLYFVAECGISLSRELRHVRMRSGINTTLGYLENINLWIRNNSDTNFYGWWKREVNLKAVNKMKRRH